MGINLRRMAPRWQEQAKSIYISARFKSEWFWKTFKDCVTGYYMDKNLRYNIFATDIFTAINRSKLGGVF